MRKLLVAGLTTALLGLTSPAFADDEPTKADAYANLIENGWTPNTAPVRRPKYEPCARYDGPNLPCVYAAKLRGEIGPSYILWRTGNKKYVSHRRARMLAYPHGR